MSIKTPLILMLAVTIAVPLSAVRKKKPADRAMLEKMESVPCGAKQRGVSGVGALFGSVGVTHVNSNEKLCPQYLVRSDEMEYQIRPTDKGHPVVLPVGHEIEFKIKKDRMFLRVPDGDQKMRAYQVVAMEPANPGGEDAAGRSDKP